MHNREHVLFKGMRSFRQLFPALLGWCILFNSVNLFGQSNTEKHWVGTWSSAQYAEGTNTPPKALADNTLRQVIRVSIGGDTLRVKFSNSTCASAVTFKAVTIAESKGGSTVDAATIKTLKFNGSTTVTMNAKSTVTSDPVAFNLTPSMRLAITIYYGQCQISSDMTGHANSRGDSYILTGDKTSSADFSGATTVAHWYHINTVDVWATKAVAAVAVLGNSITDGYGLTGGLQNRWTDIFSESLLKNAATQQVGVLNLGIGATNVLGTDPTSGISRFQNDILDQQGLAWVIIYYGVNDIGGGVSAANLIDGYKKLIADAHAKNLKVYGGTIMPFKGDTYYTVAHEACRSDVNKWIRTAGNFDGVIDFDKVMRDPTDTTKLQQALQNGWLHPSVAGYKVMGESVDVKMFVLPPVNVIRAEEHKGYALGEISLNRGDNNRMIAFELPHETFVSLKVYSILGKEVTELAGKNFPAGKHWVKFENRNLAQGIYLFTLKADKFSTSRKMIFPVSRVIY